MKLVGGFLMFLGLLLVAGSGGDCDGQCMENANTIGEMLLYALAGFVMMLSGVFMIYAAGGFNEGR